MENGLLKLIVVPSPSSFPKGYKHSTVLEKLSRQYRLVILFKFGDEAYELPKDYIFPGNVKSVDFSYETLDSSLQELKYLLTEYGIDVVSRHEGFRLPFVLGGSILQVPQDVDLQFLGTGSIDLGDSRCEVPILDAEWDL